MRVLILLAFVIGVAYCAPQVLYYELEYKPVVAPQGQPVRGFIKHEIPQPAGRESIEVLYPFDIPQPAPAAPAAPAAPVVPAAPAPVPKDDDDDHDD
ncbi:hypothetical protein QQF64_000816 [Cirrhinus molitorella]|uniref:Secretory calcium-binding phosphoprotein 7 n=1 Tax=Cirrhinus molitorella TaxID=172907 RepID=A0ABR3NY91_9TELE